MREEGFHSVGAERQGHGAEHGGSDDQQPHPVVQKGGDPAESATPGGGAGSGVVEGVHQVGVLSPRRWNRRSQFCVHQRSCHQMYVC